MNTHNDGIEQLNEAEYKVFRQSATVTGAMRSCPTARMMIFLRIIPLLLVIITKFKVEKNFTPKV